jgi:hypothetical protein
VITACTGGTFSPIHKSFIGRDTDSLSMGKSVETSASVSLPKGHSSAHLRREQGAGLAGLAGSSPGPPLPRKPQGCRPSPNLSGLIHVFLALNFVRPMNSDFC